uniref:NADH-ubiquinone oxidoreductase chain 4 n=1 Tax=Aenictopecheidae sp. PJ-2015 TaxID=1663421 RepID=A0A3S6CBJ2_9HEMI|nr:NADH dehydrogenase subunit 4 [Aenictopecheidae sp. PJ-2015]
MMSLVLYLFFSLILIMMNYWYMFMYMYMYMILMLLLNFHFGMYFMNLSYFMGMDMLSIVMVLLTIWILFLMILASYNINIKNKYKMEFMLVLLFLMLMLYLCFSVWNFILFYIFFESSLIPTLFLIFGWGYQSERIIAGIYLLFYTLFASLPLLLSIMYMYNFYNMMIFFMKINCNMYMYMCLIMAFLIKMPMIFFHFWLPKAHVEAPISGSMILAGVLLKLGGYGLMRVMGMMFNFALNINIYFMCLSLYGMVMVGGICLMQNDMKSLIAYSSVGHMGLVICGIFSLNYYGMFGSLIMMVGHGLCSSGLFCLSNINYEVVKSRSLYINKGLTTFMPIMMMFWFLFCINNMASPPSLNLVGEILLLSSIMSWSIYSFIFLFVASFMSCCYSIYLFSYNQHGLLFSNLKFLVMNNIREYMLLLLHWIPLNFLIMKIDIFMLWL